VNILDPALAITIFIIATITAHLITFLFKNQANIEAPATGARFKEIDGLRGFLAVGVFIHHAVINWFYINSGKIELPPSNLYAQLGQGSVALFFMITSFLFWGQLLEKGEHYKWKTFFISRAFRIYPLYTALMILVFIFVFHESSWKLHSSPPDLVKQIIQWALFDRPDINSYQNTGMIISNVTWTLNYEVFFYTSLPLIYLIFLKKTNWKITAFCILLIFFLHNAFEWSHSLKKNILLSFLGGILAAYWVRQPFLLDLAQSRLASIIAITSITIAFTAFHKSFSALPLILITIFFTVLASGNKLFSKLKARPVSWLGEISYSIYLLHGLLLWLATNQIKRLTTEGTLNETNYIYITLLLTPALIAISTLTHISIEKPWISIGKKISRKINKK